MTDKEGLIILARHRRIEGAVSVAESLWPGSHHHRKTNGATLARAAGAMMKRLERQGLVAIFPGVWRKTYEITEKGLTHLGASVVLPAEHVKIVSVRLCGRAACAGDEEGSNSAECGRDAGWNKLKHSAFQEWFSRCPKRCGQCARSTNADRRKAKVGFKQRKITCCNICHAERERGLWMCVLDLPGQTEPLEMCCSIAKAILTKHEIASLHSEVIFDQHQRLSSRTSLA